MPKASATLATLHRIHTQLEDLTAKLGRLPLQVKAKKAGVAKLEADLEAAREQVKQTKLNADRKQLDLKASETRIGDWNNQLNAAQSNKEYQTLQEQIAAAEMANSVLADEILEMLERVDEQENEVGRARDNLDSGKAELQRFAAGVEEQAASAKADIDRLEGELVETVKELPGDYRGEYKRMVTAKGAEGLAAAEDGVCTGCGQSLTLNMQSNLALDKPCFCGSCGAMLYLPE
ncbi:MAG: phospholipase [Planctomycetota bacterium]